MFSEADLTNPFFFQITRFCQDLVFKRSVDIINEIQLALPEHEKFGCLIIEEGCLNGVEIGQPVARRILLEIIFIF